MSNRQFKILISVNILIGCIAVVALVVSTIQYQNNLRIAYVENNRVLSEYRAVQESTALYEKKLDNWKTNLDTLESEINKDIAEFKSNYKKMSEQERELSEQLIKKKQENYYGYKKAIEEKASEEDEKLTTAVLNQIDSYLLDYGNQSDFDFIIGITEKGNLLYARDHSNITDDIVAGLNKQYEGQ